MEIAHDDAPPTAGMIFRLWATIGLQSFGGGASTLLLVRRTFVEAHSWIESDEFGHFWNLCQFTPGINLLALTVLIGRKLAGPQGVIASLIGLLLPSATITCLLAAGFAAVQQNPVVHAAVRGVIPATAGVMGVVALNFARPPLQRARREGPRAVCLSGALILLGALGLILFQLPVVVVLVILALLGAAVFTPWRTPATAPPDPERPREEGTA